MKATVEQLRIARQFRIPTSKAHTINVQRAQAYKEYLQSDKARLEQFLNSTTRTI